MRPVLSPDTLVEVPETQLPARFAGFARRTTASGLTVAEAQLTTAMSDRGFDVFEPYECMIPTRCDQCRHSHKMIRWHYHCYACNAHIHALGGKCYFKHQHEHLTGQRAGSRTPAGKWMLQLIDWEGYALDNATIYRAWTTGRCVTCDKTRFDGVSLTVDHLDGNHANNHWSNCATYCTKHHNRKTIVFGDHLPKYKRGAR